MLLHFTGLALTIAMRMGPILTAPTAVVDSITDSSITAEQLARYIAVRKEIQSYWQVPAHSALHRVGESMARSITLPVDSATLTVQLWDYVDLIKRDTALAAIFTRHHCEPQWYAAMSLKVGQALSMLNLVAAAKGVVTLPSEGTVFRKNIELIKAHQQELAAVGATIVTTLGQGGGGMGGDNNGTNP